MILAAKKAGVTPHFILKALTAYRRPLRALRFLSINRCPSTSCSFPAKARSSFYLKPAIRQYCPNIFISFISGLILPCKSVKYVLGAGVQALYDT